MDAGPHESEGAATEAASASVAPVANEVRLEVPAESRFARVVRVAVSAAAVRRGVEVAVIEDLRIAVDEALILLLRAGSAASDDTTRSAATEPSRRLVLTMADSEAMTIGLRLSPARTDPFDGPDDRIALSRFHELVPWRVEVTTIDPATSRVVLTLH